MVIREGKEIQMPTDADDCAAWVMDQNRNVRFQGCEIKLILFVPEHFDRETKS